MLERRRNRMVQHLKTLGIAVVGGTLFHLIGLPLAWLVGPLTAVALAVHFGVKLATWPTSLYKAGLLLLGYALGANFVPDLFQALLLHLPAMFISTLTLVFFCVLIALGLSKLTGEELASLMIGSMPGGLSQMLVLGDELETDLNIVTLMQVIRILCVVFLMPWLAIGLAQHTSSALSLDVAETVHRAGAENGYMLVLFLLVSWASGWLAAKVKLPTPYLVGPIISTIVLITCGLTAPSLPSPLFMLSQVLLGARLGLQVDIKRIMSLKRVALFAFLSTLCLIVISFGLAFLIQNIYQVSLLSAFLGTAPGGMVEMAITASEVKADVLLVTGYQMFRIFFLLLIVPPVIKWSFKHWTKGKSSSVNQEQAM